MKLESLLHGTFRDQVPFKGAARGTLKGLIRVLLRTYSGIIRLFKALLRVGQPRPHEDLDKAIRTPGPRREQPTPYQGPNQAFLRTPGPSGGQPRPYKGLNKAN